MLLAYVPLRVSLLQALALAAKVDDAARAKASKNNEMRDFMYPTIFLTLFITSP
jgi:hypothetical protein